MSYIQINVRNESTVVTDEDVTKVVVALQSQVSDHYYPAWGLDAQLLPIPKGAQSPATPDAWELVILDNSDQADALGYHDTGRNGQPLGKVFAKTDLDAGLQWSVTASHELLEMLADPGINLTVFREEIGQLWAYENCDACEADDLGYLIGTVLVSDFVFPSWFESFWRKGETQFDYMNKITEPFELLPGGYIGYFDIANGQGWQQRFAQGVRAQAKARPPVGSRRERRRTPRAQWMASIR